MLDLRKARKQSWEIFRREYPDYVGEDELYLRRIREILPRGARVLDAGCGWKMPFGCQIAGEVREVFGVDLGLDRQPAVENATGIEASLEALPFADASFDLVISRSVLEHLRQPQTVFGEIGRVLKPGGKFVFLVPNAWDYVSVISRLVPNRLHAVLVERIQGRDPRDTFPAYYRANSISVLRKLCAQSGLTLREGCLLSQYPAYLMFSPLAFRLGVAYDRLLRRHESLAWLRSWILGVAERVREGSAGRAGSS